MKLFFSIFSPFLLIFIIYQVFIISPQDNLKKALLNEYEDCKSSNVAQNSISWLRQCDSIKSVSKDCKKILMDEYPWEWHNQYREYFKGNMSNEISDGYKKYLEFNDKISECSCKTLPSNIADNINNKLRENNESCLKEFEVKSKALL